MNPVLRASQLVGGQRALARLLGITGSAVHQWMDAGHRVPAERCPAIERATGGAVTCEELRPDVDWAYLRGTRNPCDEKEAA